MDAGASKGPSDDKEGEHNEMEVEVRDGSGLHAGYFDMLALAVADTGLLVKKRAIRILWDRFVCTADVGRQLDA